MGEEEGGRGTIGERTREVGEEEGGKGTIGERTREMGEEEREDRI